MSPKVCAFTAVCEEDARWLPQYLAEAERLGMPFAVHFDRWQNAKGHIKDGPVRGLMQRVQRHRLCVGYTLSRDYSAEFTEQHKQPVFDLVAGRDFDWAMAWDVDETYERLAPEKLQALLETDADQIQCRWLNLWGDSTTVRADGDWLLGRRVKFYNLLSGRWHFDHPITNGAKLLKSPPPPRKGHRPMHTSGAWQPQFRTDVVVKRVDLVCLHWGMMTPELRRLHKERWDRVYTTAVGNNPYGFWRNALETEDKAVLEVHDYL